jgi:hypothetical protein
VTVDQPDPNRTHCPVGHPDCLAEEDARHYGDPGNVYNPGGELGAVFDGVEQQPGCLEDVVLSLRALADAMEKLNAKGWALTHPVDETGWVLMHWEGSGPPPPENSQRIDGMSAAQKVARIPARPRALHAVS